MTPIEERLPWVVTDSLPHIRRICTPGAHVFEWGSGGSSAFFIDQLCHLTTIEHSPKWADIVRRHVSSPLWDLIVVAPEPAEREMPLYRSAVIKGQMFRAYCRCVMHLAHPAVDVLMVDGRARNDCVRVGMGRVRHGGRLILDNSDRKRYDPAKALLEGCHWERKDYRGPGNGGRTWTTTIWRRPNAQ